jgi:hypothetical protein
MKYFFLFFFLLNCFNIFSQTTLYVNISVSGGSQTGQNWENAFSDLQTALAIAEYGDAIWVAKGVYYPTDGLDRNISFVLKNGIKLIGGFNGNETEVSQRDILSNETILSGNIGEPHGLDNTLHVLYGAGLDTTTKIDGFIVTKGGAIGGSGEDANYGGGLLLRPSQDVYCTCPVISNCRFEYNYAGQGGAVCMLRWDIVENYVNAIFRNCSLSFNRSRMGGGAICKVGANGSNTPFIMENCVISDNSTSMGYGGGIFFSRVEHTTLLRNCRFERDSAELLDGGGVFFAAGYEEFRGATLTMDTCTFKNNVATAGAGFVYLHEFANNVSNPPFKAQILNSLFDGNYSTNGGGSACYFFGLFKSQISSVRLRSFDIGLIC